MLPPLVPESGATKPAPVRADWPDTTGISVGWLRVCIKKTPAILLIRITSEGRNPSESLRKPVKTS